MKLFKTLLIQLTLLLAFTFYANQHTQELSATGADIHVASIAGAFTSAFDVQYPGSGADHAPGLSGSAVGFGIPKLTSRSLQASGNMPATRFPAMFFGSLRVVLVLLLLLGLVRAKPEDILQPAPDQRAG